MPHLIYEYTDNLAAEADIPGLLQKSNQVLISQGKVIPIGGVRSRAICLTDYCVADGTVDDVARGAGGPGPGEVDAGAAIGHGGNPGLASGKGDFFAVGIGKFDTIGTRTFMPSSGSGSAVLENDSLAATGRLNRFTVAIFQYAHHIYLHGHHYARGNASVFAVVAIRAAYTAQIGVGAFIIGILRVK